MRFQILFLKEFRLLVSYGSVGIDIGSAANCLPISHVLRSVGAKREVLIESAGSSGCMVIPGHYNSRLQVPWQIPEFGNGLR